MKRFIVKYVWNGLNKMLIVCTQNGFIQQSFLDLAFGGVQMQKEQRIWQQESWNP